MRLAAEAVAAMLLAGTPIARAQAMKDAAAKPLEFDVVSVHEDKSVPDPVRNPVQFGPTADGYRLHGVPINFAVMAAYEPSQGAGSGAGYFSYSQVAGMPTGILTVRYDIEAKVTAADLPKWKDPAKQPAMLRAMLQAMLAERFKLVVHREMREENIFELRVGRGGPKFKPSEATTLTDIQKKHSGAMATFGSTIAANGSTPGQIMYFGMTMPALCAQLSGVARRPIEDKTGLTGKYDITYQMELPPPPQPGMSVSAAQQELDSQIFAIVQSQLGLKLVSAKGPVEHLVIDHIERPSEN